MREVKMHLIVLLVLQKLSPDCVIKYFEIFYRKGMLEALWLKDGKILLTKFSTQLQ